MGGKVNACKVLKELKEGDHLEDLGVDGGLVLNWILKKQAERVWIIFILFRIGMSCEHDNELFGSVT